MTAKAYVTVVIIVPMNALWIFNNNNYMKKITIKGREYLYEIHRYSGDHDVSGWEETIFYNSTPIIKTKKKYLLWGPTIEYFEFDEIFKLSIDIESPEFTKKFVTSKVMEKIDLLNRKEEIARGEILEEQPCDHPFVAKEYATQPHGTCMSCGKTIIE
jgi:hypothetical protein